ncbi:hypothetical protein [Cytobacillus gottheilii]|uniref:hypothetical protein n=1 Tax=Cytobacillus gottheilii TaxID=859144 RepID=UPI0009BAE99E|nr:hypothetical protein [Cytobacillus gottheilii]
MLKKVTIMLILLSLLTACSNHFEEYKDEGMQYLQEQNYEAAIQAFEKALEEEESKEIEALKEATELLVKAIAAYKSGDFAKAAELADQLQSLSIDEEGQVWQEAQTLKEEADIALQKINEMKDKISQGKKLMEESDWDQAAEALKEAEQLASNTALKEMEDLKKEAEALGQEITKQKSAESAQTEQTEQTEETKPPAQEQSEQNDTAAEQPNEKEDKASFQETDAEELLMGYLNIEEGTNVHVRYDHMDDNGNFVLQVYERIIDNPQTNEGHTATIGWYTVNPTTQEIKDLY